MKDKCHLCGVVMQDVNYQLFSDSVESECLLGNIGVTPERANTVLSEIGLAELSNAHPQSLSGGQKQRLAIAVTLVSDKKVLLLDEPTSGLDYKNMMVMSRLLHQLAQKGVICIVVTHDMEFLQSTCNRCLRLDRNEIRDVSEINTRDL